MEGNGNLVLSPVWRARYPGFSELLSRFGAFESHIGITIIPVWAFESHTGIIIIPETEQHPTIMGVSLIVWIPGRKPPVNIFLNLLQILQILGSERLQLRCLVVQFQAHSK